MKTNIAGVIIALAAKAPAYSGSTDIQELAAYTGLSERKVQMILVCHTCFAEYTYTYKRSLEKFKRALGNERFHMLMAGQPIKLESQGEERIVVIAPRHDAATMP